MMRIFNTVLLCFPVLFALGQDKQLDRRLPGFGDTLFYATDHLPVQLTVNADGADRTWDFSGLMSAFIRKRQVEPVAAELLPGALRSSGLKVKNLDGLYTYYRMVENGIEEVGREMRLGSNTVVKAWYRNRLRFKENIRFGDEDSGTATLVTESKPVSFFKQAGLNGNFHHDSLRVEYQISYTSKFDAYGTLKLPVGVYDVIREKITTMITPVLYIRERGVWKKATVPGQLPAWLRQRTESSYAMWAEGYPEPVALVELNGTNGIVERIHYHAPRWSGRLIDHLPREQDVIAYPNPSFGPVRFDFYNLPDGQYRLEIFNILGVKLLTENLRIRSSTTIQLDLSHLKKGTYLYRLADADNNAIRSKRLVIIAP